MGKKKKKKKWDNGEMNGNDVRLQESMNTGLSETGMCRFFFFFQVSQWLYITVACTLLKILAWEHMCFSASLTEFCKKAWFHLLQSFPPQLFVSRLLLGWHQTKETLLAFLTTIGIRNISINTQQSITVENLYGQKQSTGQTLNL